MNIRFKILKALVILIFSVPSWAQVDQIYLNLYQSKIKLFKGPFIVNSFTGDYGLGQWRPDIAVDSSGYVAVVWIDERHVNNYIYAQIFDPQGKPVGPDIRLSETLGQWNCEPAIAASKTGKFIACWAQDSRQIVGQMFNIYGQKIKEQITIRDSHTYLPNPPGVAMTNSGNFLIVFDQQNINQNTGIYAYLFSKNGSRVNTIKVNDMNNYGWLGIRNFVACDSAGYFGVTWTGVMQNKKHVFLQIINPNGIKSGSNIKVTEQTSNDYSWPRLSALNNGTFLISWQQPGFRLFNRDSGFISSQINLKDSIPEINSSYYPLCASDCRRTFALVLMTGYGIPYFVSIDGTTGRLLNDPIALHNQKGELLTTNTGSLTNLVNEKWYFAYDKYIRRESNVLLQSISKDFSEMSDPITVSDDTSHGNQYAPKIAVNNEKAALITWIDTRNGQKDLYAQLIDSSGNPIGQNIQLNEKEVAYNYNDIAICSLSDGHFAVAFPANTGHKTSQIIIRKINKDGTLNSTKLVLPKNFYPSQLKLKLFSGNGSSFLLSIQTIEYKNVTSLEQMFIKNDLSTQTFGFSLKFEEEIFPVKAVDLTADKDFNILVSWINQPRSTLYAQLFDKKGAPLCPIFTVVQKYILTRVLPPEFDSKISSIEEFGFLFRDDYDLYTIKRYYNFISSKKVTLQQGIEVKYYDYDTDQKLELLKISNRKLLALVRSQQKLYSLFINDNKDTSSFDFLQQFPKITISKFSDLPAYSFDAQIINDKLFLTYASNAHGNTGFDIWCKIFQLDSINFRSEYTWEIQKLTEQFRPVFPNPFKIRTKLEYFLPVGEQVKIEVFDIRGRKIKTLLNAIQNRGSHFIYFDAHDLPSGVYFIRFEGFTTKVLKVVHLQ